MPYFNFGRAFRLRQRANGINVEADELIKAYNVHAYEEARRRRYQANSLGEARYWASVKSEVGRRIINECVDTIGYEQLEQKISESFPEVFATLNAVADERLQAHALARSIAAVPGPAAQHSAPARDKGHDIIESAVGAIREIIETEKEEVRRVFAQESVEPEPAS